MKAANPSRLSIERAARLYRSSEQACVAMGISTTMFSRLCREYGIELPHERRKRLGQCPAH